MSRPSTRPPTRTRLWIAAALAGVVAATGGCTARHYQQVSRRSNFQSLRLLEAQAVPSATLIPCLLPLPQGWSYGGAEVRSGLVRFWADSDRAGARAAEVRLTQTCNLSGATEVALKAPPGDLRGYQEPSARQPPTTVRYFVFTGGCVRYRFSFTQQTAPALFKEADQFLGFDPRAVFVNAVRDDTGLPLCGAGAPPCPG
jgi:hypothetical protein